MQTVFVAGATGYLGRHLCAEFSRRGAYVIALVRDASRARELAADSLVEAEATRPETLVGVMDGADLVLSALGITRQSDGLGYHDVDYQANVNLLREAERAGVGRFAYIHVLNGENMRTVPLVAAKTAFVRALQASALASIVIAPSGFFTDMGDFLSMARSGRVWLFGDGSHRINPIHGADLATATADAIEAGQDWLDLGGPDAFSHTALAELAFETLGRPARITHLPDNLRRLALRVLPWLTPRRIHGPAQFFLTAMAMDMVGLPHGTHRLADHFRSMAKSSSEDRPARYAVGTGD
ncbi:SDR family oxidoreductase [Tropicimonas sp. TH_r6]|uniref:SDR family oxidoreductase n=1 Tax=Tropicimonas sp. TH_r6 TaxID=3082085 RepID=UPI00295395E6|nr:SDR family oxidoreductase [Tropicimonas sp. TH_r6]MDV7143864.1 SDR family oxidoreductase [Tropicimonas sp. TH_r6]